MKRAAHTGSDKCFLIGDGPDHVTIDGNTVEGVNIGSGFYLNGKPKATELTIINNRIPKCKYGCCGGMRWARKRGTPSWRAVSTRGTPKCNALQCEGGNSAPLPYLNSLIIGRIAPEVQGVRLARDHDGEP